jgi:hypothetical protein
MQTARFSFACSTFGPRNPELGRHPELFAVVFTRRKQVVHALWDEDVAFNFLLREHRTLDAEGHGNMVDL